MMMHRTAPAAFGLLLAGALGLSACAGAGAERAQGSAATEQAPPDSAREPATPPEAAAGGDTGDESFSKSGVVLLLDSQLGGFGGSGRWEGDELIVAFDGELGGGDGLDLAFVCGFMDGLVLDTHTTAVETPSSTTDCAASPQAP